MQTAKGKVKRRRAPRTTNTQYALMLDYCARHNILISGRQTNNPGSNEDIDKLWCKLAALLNSCGAGSSKSIDQWKRTWVEWKCNTKRRYRELNDDKCTNGKLGARGLSPLEQQLMHLIGTIDCSSNQTDLMKEDKDPSPLDSLEMVLENSSSEESNNSIEGANTANLPSPHFFQYAESATTAELNNTRDPLIPSSSDLPNAFNMINSSLNNVALAIRELAAAQFKMADSNYKLAEVIIQQINLNAEKK